MSTIYVQLVPSPGDGEYRAERDVLEALSLPLIVLSQSPLSKVGYRMS